MKAWAIRNAFVANYGRTIPILVRLDDKTGELSPPSKLELDAAMRVLNEHADAVRRRAERSKRKTVKP